MKISIIKIGGNVIDFPEKLDEFLGQFAKFPGHKILVHGGGIMASRFGESLGVMPEMVDGRRITDKDTLDIVTMVYAGLINKNIIAKLQALHVNGIGMSGADGNIIRSKKRPVKGIDYGFVGDIQEVNTDLIKHLLSADLVPVLSAITHDKKGQLLNTNADSIASALATSLAKEHQVNLYFCFNKSGVLLDEKNENSIIPRINEDIYAELRKENVIHSGMIPKLDNAFEALQKGVHNVWIGKAENLMLSTKGKLSGTIIERHRYDLY
ncbi:acetylglutamate kinase [Algoriphagus zhangzhouensis]|uniref:Acetylglutamate kinase n=1 Tax=Algoriphagus zhangzhouensis TaxID=1073327 RepID=A0A1M7Z5G2_9BACT|nr:acetylglutamate kinase [Algoriphagus zhangzhouensis]TDY48888.1 N-acetylglutamate kinase [Algoriphagus zhangzhouensis]SHO60109.1 N-acetylglutamate kinase [Algoriphagus zhangzhouensis]